jgi:hypothetical protein
VAIGSFGRHSAFQSGSRSSSSRVGFAQSITGGNKFAGNEGFACAESRVHAKATATTSGGVTY